MPRAHSTMTKNWIFKFERENGNSRGTRRLLKLGGHRSLDIFIVFLFGFILLLDFVVSH